MAENIFDSHAHYNDPAFSEDADEVVSSLPGKGVSGIINVGYDLDVTRLAMEQSKKFHYMWFSAGIHPHNSADVPNDYLTRLKEFAADERCVAIGEIGLDYFRNDVPHEIQKKVFSEQINLARELNLPIIIHTREATADTLELLKSEGYYNGVVHCFSSSAETAKQLLALGFYIGFTGVVTFKNAKKAILAAQAVPLDRLLVETDCPYMAPVPFRGERCTSDMIYYTAQKLSEIKGVDPGELLKITQENALRLFNIKL